MAATGSSQQNKIKIIFGTLVDFDKIMAKFEKDACIRVVINKVKESGTAPQIYEIPSKYDEEVVARFYKGARIEKNTKTREEEIVARIKGQTTVVINPWTLSTHLQTPCEGVEVLSLGTSPDADRVWWREFTRDKSFNSFSPTFKKNELLEEYGYLYDIVGKGLEGRLGGHDKGTSRMWAIMIAIMKSVNQFSC